VSGDSVRAEAKQAIFEYVERHDSQHEIVHLAPSDDWSGGTIRFSSDIVQRRVETVLSGEKYVEAYFLVRAVRERRYESRHFELQKEYSIGRPRPTGARADILLHTRSGGRLFCLIEAKDPEDFERNKLSYIKGQLFAVGQHERSNGLTYLCYYTVDLVGTSLIEQVVIIDFEKYATYDDWFSSGAFSTDIFPVDYGRSTKSVYVNKAANDLHAGEKSLNKSAGQTVFFSLRRNLHDVLWAGGGMFYNEIFTNLVKLILTKIYGSIMVPGG
jgi:type I restriction enzyme M protein